MNRTYVNRHRLTESAASYRWSVKNAEAKYKGYTDPKISYLYRNDALYYKQLDRALDELIAARKELLRRNKMRPVLGDRDNSQDWDAVFCTREFQLKEEAMDKEWAKMGYDHSINVVMKRLNEGKIMTPQELLFCKKWLIEFRGNNSLTPYWLDRYCFEEKEWFSETIGAWVKEQCEKSISEIQNSLAWSLGKVKKEVSEENQFKI